MKTQLRKRKVKKRDEENEVYTNNEIFEISE